MAAERDPRYDTAIVMRYAAWAGDWAYVDYLSEQVQEAQEALRTGESRREGIPPKYLTFGESAKARIIRRMGKEARERVPKLVEGSDATAQGVPDVPVLVTSNLRGVVTQRSTVDFEMRAYAANISWEPQVQEHARGIAQRFAQYIEFEPIVEERSMPKKAIRIREVIGSAWVAPGPLQCVVIVDPLGLISVRAQWTVGDPVSLETVFDVLRRLLLELDEGAPSRA